MGPVYDSRILCIAVLMSKYWDSVITNYIIKKV